MTENTLNYGSMMTPEVIEKAKMLGSQLTSNEKDKEKTAISWLFLTDIIKTKIRETIQGKRKIIDFFSLFLSLLSVAAEILQCTLYIHTKVIKTSTMASILITTKSSTFIEVVRGLNSFFTSILLLLICAHYQIHKNLLIFKQYYEINSSIWSTKLFIQLGIELIICIIHTPPYFNNIKITITSVNLVEPMKYKIDIVLFVTMFSMIKLYLVFKFFFNYSQWGDDRANRICKESNISHNILFVLKAELTEHPILILSIFYGSTILIFGYCIRSCEIGFSDQIPLYLFQDWTSHWNGFWCIFVSITTVGYGDFTPRTLMGRIICIIASFIGIIIFGLLITSLHSKLSMNNSENRAFNEINVTLLLKKLKAKALKVILSYYRLMRVIENEKIDLFQKNEDLQIEKEKIKRKGIKQIESHIHEYRKFRHKIEDIKRRTTIDNQIYQISRSLNENLEFLVTTSRIEINSLANHINFSQNFSQIIKGYSQILKIMTSYMNNAIVYQKQDLITK